MDCKVSEALKADEEKATGMKDLSQKKYTFFNHNECEFFPCHKTNDPENFNCLFCYCPLYALGKDCGGNFHFTEDGIKDCAACMFPHVRENYSKIVARYQDIIKKF